MVRNLVSAFTSFVLVSTAVPCVAQVSGSSEQRLAALESRLRAASLELAALTQEIETLKKDRPTAAPRSARTSQAAPDAVPLEARHSFEQQILGSTRQQLEASTPLPVKPQIFLQSRFSTFPMEDATLADYSPNFRVSRLSARWAGSVDDRWGAGIEFQYRAAPDNVPEQLLNDAYLDFRATKALTIRAGQFVKPFGFEVQQLDPERESPERAMFAGYIFPGERDRGVMVMGNLFSACNCREGLSYAAAVVNGNRFFSDSNSQVNYLFRVRRVQKNVAYGGSVQLGTQITPPGVAQSNNENAFGADVQWATGRLGLRAEFVHANRPSTFLAPDPVFTPAFVEGERVRSVGSSVTALWSLSNDRQLYVRFDRLAGDTVTICPDLKDGSCKVNAVNGGLRQRIAEHGLVGVDLQWKNRVSFNSDAVNTRLQITSSLVF
jgi:hypothetical protein